ncbi:MAG: AMP-binding protein, partial [Actinomycetota bacterium]|nr:AMP-binding protein [Actinomycetota bacterium]
RVGLALPAGRAFAEALHGCWLLGAVAVPLDLRLGEEERSAQSEGCATVLDGPPDLSAPATPLRTTHDLDAVAAVVHTSGTSGRPTPVELTYGNWLWSAMGSALTLGLDAEERWLCPLPPSHVGGLSIVVRSAIYGTTAVLHERFDADAVAAALPSCTLVSLVPTTLARVLDAGMTEPGRLRCALIGGGPVPPALLERAREAGVPLAQTYGLTQACSQVTTSAIGDPSTAGPPLFCTRVEIADDGEILVAGPTVAPGATGPDGRLHTGDLGTLDDHGRLTVTGRRSETIVTGGENVAPAEVEAVLEAHPAVAEAAVHARPDSEWGEAIVATVVPRDGVRLDPDDLRAHCRATLAGFKVPKAIEIATSLPRTASGKLRRDALE